MDDLRQWMDRADRLGRLKTVHGLDWDLEIGAAMDPRVLGKTPEAVIFDDIQGYPAGRRIAAYTLKNVPLISMAFGLLPPDGNISKEQLVGELHARIPGWESDISRYAPRQVSSGRVMENVEKGPQVDLTRFPAPKWHQQDAGRYLGTGCAVITRDPDTGEVNLGTYRVMLHDDKTVGLHISPGKHGRLHYEKYHARGLPCPVAISLGHHPLFLAIASTPVNYPEYNYIGAITGEAVPVITEELTGLPIPADSEAVIAGWCPPDKNLWKMEGPYGEWTGYYSASARLQPVVNIERVYYRNGPILMGSPPLRPPYSMVRYNSIFTSALLHTQLDRLGIDGVKGVAISEVVDKFFLVVSIKQRYAGHAKRAALLASQCSPIGAYNGRYVIVVDDDIDPFDMDDVLWAVCTRSDPEKSIDIMRRTWSSALDPIIKKPTNAFFSSVAIIDACKPFEWMDEFPKTSAASPELVARVKAKLGITD